MGNRFDPAKESSYITYLDVNNLCGYVMSQNLANREKLKGCISKLAKKQSKGYLLEVDMSYHSNLHNLHNGLPFMCEKMKITGVQKLEKYVIHIMASDQAFKHRLILDRVHQVIKFDQSTWLALYINFNIQLRARAKNDFEKDFFKLKNNVVFEKTMENIKKHRTSSS